MTLFAIATLGAAAISAATAAEETTTACNNAFTQSWFANPVLDYKGAPQLRINRTVGNVGDVSAHTCGKRCLSYGDNHGEGNGPCVAFSVQVEYGVCQLFRAPTLICMEDSADDAAVNAAAVGGGGGNVVSTEEFESGEESGEENVVAGRRKRCMTEADLPLHPGSGQAHFTRLSECDARVFGEEVSTTTTITTPLMLCEGSVSLWFDTPVYDHKGPLALRVNRYFGPATVAECAQVCVKHETGCTAFSFHADDVTCQIFEGFPDITNEEHSLEYALNTVHYTRKTECSEGRDPDVAAAWKHEATHAVCGLEPFIDGFEDPVEHFKGILDDRMTRYSASSLTAEHCAASCVEHSPTCTAFSFNEARFVCQLFRTDPDVKPELEYQNGQNHYVRKTMCFDSDDIMIEQPPSSTEVPVMRILNMGGSGADDDYYTNGESGRQETASSSTEQPETETETARTTSTSPTSPTTVATVKETTTTKTVAKTVTITKTATTTSVKTQRPPAFLPPKVSTNDVVFNVHGFPVASDAPDFVDGAESGGDTTFQSKDKDADKQPGPAEIAEIATAILVVSLLMIAFFVWVYREHYPESKTVPLGANYGTGQPTRHPRLEHIPLLNPTLIVPVPLTLDDYMIPNNSSHYNDVSSYPRTPERYSGV